MTQTATNPVASSADGRLYAKAALLSILPMFAGSVSRGSGWDSDIVSLTMMLVTIPLLFRLLPEGWEPRLRSLQCFAVGVALGFLVFWLRYRNVSHEGRFQVSNGLLGVIVSLALTGLVIPIWEEKSCRQILFFGLGRVMPLLLSAILVSAVFAWVHRGNEPMTFVLSLALCWAAYKGINTWDRALFHGAYNLSLVVPQYYLAKLF